MSSRPVYRMCALMLASKGQPDRIIIIIIIITEIFRVA